MKPVMKRALIVAAALLVLGGVNWSILAKERIKENGESILLALAPVDPRSLMQGDYMALRFAIESHIPTDTGGSIGLLVDANRVATVNPDQNAGGLRIKYRIRNGRVWIGTNAYFFEEGTAERYAGAKFGEFRVDRDTGEAVLTGLRETTY